MRTRVSGVRVLFQLPVEVPPALPAAVDQELLHRGGKLRLRLLHRLGDLPVSGADDGGHIGGVHPVDHILFGEEVGGGDDNRPYLVEGQNGEPELIMAL